MNRILLLACTLAFSSAALAQLYKSIDKDGRVIYSDQPPAAAVDPGISAAARSVGPLSAL